MSFDCFIDRGHKRNRLFKSPNRQDEARDLWQRQAPPSTILQPLLTDSVATNLLLPCVFRHRLEPTRLFAVKPHEIPVEGGCVNEHGLELARAHGDEDLVMVQTTNLGTVAYTRGKPCGGNPALGAGSRLSRSPGQ